MTEDDTFRRLKRLPFEEMRQQIIQISYQQVKDGPRSTKRKIDALEAGGWKLEEYQDERARDAQRRISAAAAARLHGFKAK